MQNFIVLGIIPGTDFQITFNFWLLAAVLLASLPLVRRAWHQRNNVRVYIVSMQLNWVIDRFQIPA